MKKLLNNKFWKSEFWYWTELTFEIAIIGACLVFIGKFIIELITLLGGW